MKLPAHRAGLPGKVISFYIVPLPAYRRQGPRLSRFGGTGHVPVKSPPLSSLPSKLSDDMSHS